MINIRSYITGLPEKELSFRVVASRFMRIIKSVQPHPNRGNHPFYSYNERLFDNILVSSWYLFSIFRFAKLWKISGKLWLCIYANIIFFNDSVWENRSKKRREDIQSSVRPDTFDEVHTMSLFWNSPVFFWFGL